MLNLDSTSTGPQSIVDSKILESSYCHKRLVLLTATSEVGAWRWGGVGNHNVHVPVHTHRRGNRHCSFIISYCWAGTATSSSFLLSCRHRHSSFIISYWWGGVGWDNNVHVPVHTQARQPHHLSCSPADTGTALSSSVTAGVGWGGIKNVHVPVHTQARQPHHLSCCPADTGTALSSLVTGGVGWGGLGWVLLAMCSYVRCTHQYA